MAINAFAPRRKYKYTNNVTIDCPMEKALGLQIAEETLTVRHVHPGGWVAAWNAENPFRAVVEGDSILSVNGLKDDLPAMLSVLKMKPTNRKKTLSVVFRIEDSADTNLLELDLSDSNLV